MRGARRAPAPALAALAVGVAALAVPAAARPTTDVPAAAGPARSHLDDPHTWPVRFSEVYHFAQGEVGQIRLSWPDLKARRFYLILDAPRSFDATLTRARDGSMLYSGRRASHHEAMIPWGKDEVADLMLKGRQEGGLYVTVKMATDPAEAGLAIYSLHLNRFLQLYAQKRMAQAKQALELAIDEDPTDSVTAMLWRRLWREEGLTEPPLKVTTDEQERQLWLRVSEGQRMHQLRMRIRQALALAGPDSARRVLEAARPFETRAGKMRRLLLEGDLALEEVAPERAIPSLESALRRATTASERFDVYRLLVRAHRALGEQIEAKALIRRAILDAPDLARLREAESW